MIKYLCLIALTLNFVLAHEYLNLGSHSLHSPFEYIGIASQQQTSHASAQTTTTPTHNIHFQFILYHNKSVKWALFNICWPILFKDCSWHLAPCAYFTFSPKIFMAFSCIWKRIFFFCIFFQKQCHENIQPGHVVPFFQYKIYTPKNNAKCALSALHCCRCGLANYDHTSVKPAKDTPCSLV